MVDQYDRKLVNGFMNTLIVVSVLGCLLSPGVGGVSGGVGGMVFAGERRFAYSYQATTHAPGEWEYEQWVTWKASKGIDSTFDRFDFRHEIELGLTDRLQIGLYLADWRYQDGRSVDPDRAEFRDVAVELIYNLTHPVTDPLGLAAYGEVKIGDELLELETKLIAQKDLGPWTLVYNITLEAEWEGDDYEEDKGVLEQSFGVGYQFSPNFILGGEMLHELEFDDWDETGDYVVYLGPTVTYRSEGWWVVVSPLFQLTDVDTEVDFVTRLVLGIDF